MGWLNHDLLDTGISVAELVVAAIGLGGGGYAGALRATLTRARHEDRRRLLGLSGLQPDFVVFDLVEQADGTKMRVHTVQNGSTEKLVMALEASLKEAAAIVDLLPWLDRVAWQRVIREVDPVTSWMFTSWDHQKIVWESWLEEGGERQYFKALKPFLDHLHREVRPGVFRRAKSVGYRWDLVRRGPWNV
jgi:hypothetical protein